MILKDLFSHFSSAPSLKSQGFFFFSKALHKNKYNKLLVLTVMCNSVTGTVEASSGRASQRKPGQGLIAVTLRGFFLFTVCQNSDSCWLLFSPRSLSLSEFFQISCFPVLEVLYSDRSHRRLRAPTVGSELPPPLASALLTCAFSLESSLCWQRHHNTEEPLPWMLQGAVG